MNKIPVLKTKVSIEDTKAKKVKDMGWFYVVLPFEIAFDEGKARVAVIDKIRRALQPHMGANQKVLNTWVHNDIHLQPRWKIEAWRRLPFKESRLII